jgi:hypothetical protein
MTEAAHENHAAAAQVPSVSHYGGAGGERSIISRMTGTGAQRVRATG